MTIKSYMPPLQKLVLVYRKGHDLNAISEHFVFCHNGFQCLVDRKRGSKPVYRVAARGFFTPSDFMDKWTSLCESPDVDKCITFYETLVSNYLAINKVRPYDV